MNSKYIWVLALLLTGCQTAPTSNDSQADGSESAQTVSAASTPKKVEQPPKETAPQDQENLWDRISSQFTLEIPDDPSIAYYRDWYLKHPQHLKTVSKRAEPFLYMITTRIEEQNLPLELTLLPVVESAFDPFAYSYGSAAGLWQFVPVTADRFGLERNYWYDGRRDVSASTDAALEYMTYLGNRFNGDWEHAIAAYNSGGGRVSSAIRKNTKAGLPTDFFSLTLPKETRGYVPKLLALADILTHQDKYGVELPVIANKPVLTTVNPQEQLDLAIAAQYAGISVEELQSYNPGFNQWAMAPDGPYNLLIPIEKAKQFNEQAAKHKGQGLKITRHKVIPGDSLSLLARNYNTTTANIQQLNNLDDAGIRVGQYLLVPKSSSKSKSYPLTADNRLAKLRATSSNGRLKSTYTVRNGDNLGSIAQAHKVSTENLAKWNGMAPKDTLRVGEKLVIWKETKSSSAVTRTVIYRVRQGDTVSAIAQKFKVNSNDILTWNDLNTQDYLKPGQQIKLYVDVTKISA